MQLSVAIRPHRCLHTLKLQQYRFKSGTPGPLEARRRATKRKYVGAASSLGNRSGVDDIVPAFGSSPRSHEFPSPQSVLPPRSIEPSRNDAPLPPWLTGALKELEVEQNRSSPVKVDEWKEGLIKCQTTHSVVELARRTNTWLGDSSVFKLAFEHLCGVQDSVHEVLEFLDHRNMNTPGALDLACFLNNFASTIDNKQRPLSWIRTAGSRVTQWLKKEVSTGNLTEREIRDVARWATLTRLQDSKQLDMFRVHVVFGTVKGIFESSIRHPHQLQPSTIRCILRALASVRTIKARESALSSVINLLKAASNGSSSQAIQYTETYLRSFFSHNDHPTKFTHAWRLVRSMAGTGDWTDLNTLGMSGSSTQTVRGKRMWPLFYMTRSDVFQKMPLSFWKETCLKLRPEIDPIIAQGRPLLVCAFLDAIRPAGGAKFLFDQWILPLCGSTMEYPAILNKRVYASQETLKSGFADHIEAFNLQPGLGPYFGLLSFMKQVSDTMAESCTNRLITTFVLGSKPASAYLLYQHARMQGISLRSPTLIALVNQLSHENPTQALELFCSEPDLRIEYCLPLAAAIVATPSIPTETIFPLLSRSTYRFSPHPKTLQASEKRLLAFGPGLARMLSESDCEATAKLGLVSRLLEIYDEYHEKLGWMSQTPALKSEVFGPFARGERTGLTARGKLLKRVAKLEGTAMSDRLSNIINAWEAMEAPLRGDFARRGTLIQNTLRRQE